MVLPNNTHTSGGSGTVFPTHLIGSNEYPVGLEADQDGHIKGSLPAFGLMIPPSAVGASKRYFDLHNAMGSGIIRLRKLFAIVATDVAVTGVVGVRLDMFRTSAVGTGGTAATLTASASTTIPLVYPFTPGVAVPSGITARTVPTAGATNEQFLFPAYVFTEETSAPAQQSQWFNLLPELPNGQTIELPVGKGLHVVQGTVASVGNIGFLVAFTVE